VVSAGAHIIDQIDEITDDLGEAVPGGGVINWMADMALVPGRYFVSVARTALGGLGDELNPPGQPSVGGRQSHPPCRSGDCAHVRRGVLNES
jgi:hypothetical protein